MYDLVIIGSGPGGYVAALRAGQLGLKVALVEKHKELGGTCLNVGCIPSKALLDSSERYYDAVKHFDVHGISIGQVKLDWAKMLERKNNVIATTTQGIVGLCKKNKVDVIQGLASFKDSKTITVTSDEGTQEVQASKFIIATGSRPISIPNVEIDRKRIITSTEALSLKEVPKNLIVIGGGVIGLELGSVYARLGSKVTVVEYMDSLIATMDKDCGKTLQRSLKKIGIDFKLKHAVSSAEVVKKQSHYQSD